MDNQFNLFSPAATSECNTRNAEDSFACCSRFRQCSDAGYCLISDEEYSNGCSYRKNLENGKVFYGKMQQIFHYRNTTTFAHWSMVFQKKHAQNIFVFWSIFGIQNLPRLLYYGIFLPPYRDFSTLNCVNPLRV